MSILFRFFLLFFLGFSTPVFPGGVFQFSQGACDTYQKIASLRFSEAWTDLANLKKSEPDNLVLLFLENYLECATALLNDSEKDYRKWSKNMDKRLYKISQGDSKSPYFLYCQAEIRLHWAILRGRYGDYLSCVSDVKQGYALLEENQRRFPDFAANKKSLGLLHAVIGNVPDELKWAVRGVSGMKGTIAQGVQEMEEVLTYARSNPDFLFGIECFVAYSYLQLHLNNKSEAAWNTMKEMQNLARNNPLASFALANVGMRTGHNDEAIKLLEQMPAGSQYHPFPYRYFMLGIAKLYRLDKDANQPLLQFLSTYKGSFGIKEAYQKLAWYQLINNDQQGYWNYIYQAKIQGIVRADTDKAADREANSGEMPDLLLLKARLLFDGGYYQRALDLLKNNGTPYAGHEKNRLEYSYRMGRIYDQLQKTTDATRYYKATIEMGESKPWYFACNAALQLGTLYEEKREWANARVAYQKAIKINPEEYAASLHARAKAGLNRVKGK
jgi:tetratricopeptide (TPR) repeat protein